MIVIQVQRRGCSINLANHNEAVELELPRAWEPWTVRSLQKIMKDQAPKIFFLMETRLDKKGYKKHCKDLPFPNQFVVKNPNSGGV